VVELLLSLGRLLAALFLVALNGFFVASEFALVRIRSTAVDQMVEEGRAGSGTLRDALDDLDDYLAATQLGITVASLALGWIGEPAIAALIEPVLAPFLADSTVHLIAVGIGFSVVTFLHVVFGELAPKTIAIARAERLALFIAPPMKFFYYLFYPGLVVFNGAANGFTTLLGIPPASETEETLSEDEIRMVLTHAGKQGHVDAEEVEMIEQVFELDDVHARDVMVPQPDVSSVPGDMPLAELRTFVVEHGHTRYPVVDPESDEPVGYVDVKDVLAVHESGDERDLVADDLAREIPIVPETTGIDELLGTFQDEQRQMAAVIDEWGTLEGIATVEDAVEVVVGDIRDEFDEQVREPSIDELDEGSYVADGTVSVQKLNDALGTDLEATAYGTVGGLLLERLGQLPDVGDEVTAEGYTFAVEAVKGTRVERVTIRPVAEGEDGDAEEE
jgi:CBS domain containing-hemolysin-like protein